MKVITIDRKNFLKGFSMTKWTNDGGFSPESKGFEVSRGSTRGLLHNGRQLNETSTNLADNVVALTKYISGQTFGYFALGDAGKIYFTDPSPTISHTVKGTESNKTYDSNSDIIVYNNKLFFTSTNDIGQADLDFNTIDENWWTTAKSKTALTAGVPHKLFIFNGVLYITNGNKIALHDGDADTQNDAKLTLPTGWIITDVEVFSNKIFITASYGTNDLTKSTPTMIFVWDGYSENWIKELPINEAAIS